MGKVKKELDQDEQYLSYSEASDADFDYYICKIKKGGENKSKNLRNNKNRFVSPMYQINE